MIHIFKPWLRASTALCSTLHWVITHTHVPGVSDPIMRWRR